MAPNREKKDNSTPLPGLLSRALRVLLTSRHGLRAETVQRDPEFLLLFLEALILSARYAHFWPTVETRILAQILAQFDSANVILCAECNGFVRICKNNSMALQADPRAVCVEEDIFLGMLDQDLHPDVVGAFSP